MSPTVSLNSTDRARHPQNNLPPEEFKLRPSSRSTVPHGANQLRGKHGRGQSHIRAMQQPQQQQQQPFSVERQPPAQPDPSVNQGAGPNCSSPLACQSAPDYGQSYGYQPAAGGQPFCTVEGYQNWAASLGFPQVPHDLAEKVVAKARADFNCG
jgi:hypothetical protein